MKRKHQRKRRDWQFIKTVVICVLYILEILARHYSK